MIRDNLIEFKSIFDIIQECSHIREDVVLSYLGKIFDELTFRKKEKTHNMISKQTFSAYLNLPLIVSDKVYESILIDKYKRDLNLLNKNEFIKGMYSIYFSNLDCVIKSTFKFLDINHKGKISRDDALLILSYLSSSAEFKINHLEKLVEEFFDGNILLTLEEYSCTIKNNNSDLMIIILAFLYNNQPFSEKTIIYYSKVNCIKFNPDNSHTKIINNLETDISFKNFKTDEFIHNLSHDLNNCLKYVVILKKGTKRKMATKNILDFKQQNCYNFDSILTGIFPGSTNNFNCSSSSRKDYDSTLNSTNSIHNSYSIRNNSTNFCVNINEFFTTYAEIFSSLKNKFNKYKLVIIENNIFTFKYNRSKNKYIFEKVISTSGYFQTSCDVNYFQNKILYPLALLNIFGNTMANIKNVFFFKTKEENDKFLNVLRKYSNEKEIICNYNFLKRIGKGQYGRVYLAKNKLTEERVAIKVIKKSKLKEKELGIVRNEIDVVKFLMTNCHPNVVRIIDICNDKHSIYIIMENISGGTLLSI